MRSRLTALQRDLLEAFFKRERSFVLSGGAALAGFYLGHRETHDLDLFTTGDALVDGERALRDAAADIGATIESVQTAPTFRRRLVRRGDEDCSCSRQRYRSCTTFRTIANTVVCYWGCRH